MFIRTVPRTRAQSPTYRNPSSSIVEAPLLILFSRASDDPSYPTLLRGVGRIEKPLRRSPPAAAPTSSSTERPQRPPKPPKATLSSQRLELSKHLSHCAPTQRPRVARAQLSPAHGRCQPADEARATRGVVTPPHVAAPASPPQAAPPSMCAPARSVLMGRAEIMTRGSSRAMA